MSAKELSREELLDFQPHANGVHQVRLSRVPVTNCFMVRVVDTGANHCVRAVLETSEASAWAVMLRLSRAEDPAEAAL